MASGPTTPATPFADLDTFLALPRVSGLAVAPDGSRVVTTVSELNDKGTEFVSALWELDPAGRQPARRITHGAKGESSPAFTDGGDLLFAAVRPTGDDDNPPAALWRLPAAGGEAVEVLSPPGGVEAIRRRAHRPATFSREPPHRTPCGATTPPRTPPGSAAPRRPQPVCAGRYRKPLGSAAPLGSARPSSAAPRRDRQPPGRLEAGRWSVWRWALSRRAHAGLAFIAAESARIGLRAR